MSVIKAEISNVKSWRYERLKNQVRFAYGDSLSEENRIDGKIPVYGSNGVVGTHDKAITIGETIIIGRKGSFGKLQWSDGPCFPIDTTYFVDKTQTQVFLRWLYYALGDLDLDKVNFDSAVPGLSRQVAYSLRLYFPPINEQKMIAKYLDKQCAAIDKVLEIKKEQLTILDDLRKSIIHKAVTKGLDDDAELKNSEVELFGKIPKHWKFDRIKDLSTNIGSGITPEGGATVYVDEGIPLLRSQNVHFDGLRMDDVAFITEEQHAEMAGTHVQAGDVLLNITGASIGRCYYVTVKVCPANVNQHVCIIRPCPKLREKFLYYFLASSVGQGLILSCWRGASRQGLGLIELMAFVLPVPPIQEQDRIVAYLEEKNSEFHLVMSNIKNQISTLEKYRNSLIHECVTGKRRITEDDLKELANV